MKQEEFGKWEIPARYESFCLSRYDLLYRRNYTNALEMSKAVIWPLASEFGLKNVCMREATPEYLEKAQHLRGRIEAGVLNLTPDEIADLESDDALVEMVLTRIAIEEMSDLVAGDKVPWLKSFSGIQVREREVLTWKSM